MGHDFWFTSWASLARIAVFTVCAYVLVIALVRVYGKRSISKRNPSDFVMTVAIGSVVANFVLQSPVSLVDGLFAIGLFLSLQHTNEWLTTRSATLRAISEGKPTLLVYDGKPLTDTMKAQNINENELALSLRAEGYTSLEEVGAVVLEIDGTVSVLPRTEHRDELLQDVHRS